MGHNRGGSLYSLQEGGEGSTEIDGLFTPQSSSSPLFLQSLYIDTAIIIIITIITILRILFKCISYTSQSLISRFIFAFWLFTEQNSPEKKLKLPSTQGNNNIREGLEWRGVGVDHKGRAYCEVSEWKGGAVATAIAYTFNHCDHLLHPHHHRLSQGHHHLVKYGLSGQLSPYTCWWFVFKYFGANYSQIYWPVTIPT